MTILVSACADGFEIITATPPGTFVLGGGVIYNTPSRTDEKSLKDNP
ncbi:MAG: hypothetical protein FWH05_03695 [Oscillospiraceae bacterium]|nr:hypothetical protein [Oscillospiraceae bacterium]